ncbi:uncharacterized protein LOC111703570, partial [Eurytemora carolleeae]|uniref:uncharacterized protein LOC111703570 n=1 Tax=Eurytemora carolleeae TaxID=1294199 RepID=UPI000C76C7BD
MFKSSFAREIIEETKQNANLDSILSSDLNSAYKSSFAASTHSALDNMPVNIEAVEPRFSLRNINLEDTSAELATSDLGTSDFSSSELWPSSDRQLEDIISGYPSSAASKFGSRVEEKRENNPSFLNLDSQMPFSYLEQVCTNLDVGLIASDWTRLKKILLEGRRRGEGERRRGDEYVVLGDFLSELQALRRGKRGRHLNNSRETPESMSTENTSDSDESKMGREI